MQVVHTLSFGLDALPAPLLGHIQHCSSCGVQWERAMALEQWHCTSNDAVSGIDESLMLPDRGISYTRMICPLGPLWIALSPKGLVALETWQDELAFCTQLERQQRVEARSDAGLLAPVTRQIAEYFAGQRTRFAIPVDLGSVTPFQRSVLQAVSAVPYGETRSYADIARTIGKPGATRAVGTAVATNPVSLIVPCHRIVRADGSPGEYARRSLGSCGIPYKLMLLALEVATSKRLN